MTDHLPPSHNYAQIAGTVSAVADNLDSARLSGGLLGIFTGGQKRRGEALMDGSRILLENCGPLMNRVDQANVQHEFKAARDAKTVLDASGASGLQGLRMAREFRRLSKKAYRAAKAASDRALDDNILRPLDGTDPPTGTPPSTPEEPDTPPPHDPGTDSLNVDDASVQGGEVPTAGPPPGPYLDQMTDRAQEADCASHISSQGLGSEAGADD